jgi:hypothetical protein
MFGVVRYVAKRTLFTLIIFNCKISPKIFWRFEKSAYICGVLGIGEPNTGHTEHSTYIEYNKP